MRSFYSQKDLTCVWRKLINNSVYLWVPINYDGYEVSFKFPIKSGECGYTGITFARHTSDGFWILYYGITDELLPTWLVVSLQYYN